MQAVLVDIRTACIQRGFNTRRREARGGIDPQPAEASSGTRDLSRMGYST
jgi:hypothetical protein